MVKHVKVKEFNILFVFRHKWEKKKELLNSIDFRKYELGVFFEKTKVVSKNGFSNPKNWKLVPSFMLGVNLLVCKFWITIDYNVMHLGE